MADTIHHISQKWAVIRLHQQERRRLRTEPGKGHVRIRRNKSNGAKDELANLREHQKRHSVQWQIGEWDEDRRKHQGSRNGKLVQRAAQGPTETTRKRSQEPTERQQTSKNS